MRHVSQHMSGARTPGAITYLRNLMRLAVAASVSLTGAGLFLTNAAGCKSSSRSPAVVAPGDIEIAPLTPAERQAYIDSFDRVWEIVRNHHYDPELGGLDWQGVREELRPEIEQAETRRDARLVLSRMVDRLGQSHFGIIPSDVYDEVTGDDEADDPDDSGADAADLNGDSEESRSDGDDQSDNGADDDEDTEGDAGLTIRVVDDRALVTDVRQGSPAEAAGVRPGWEILAINDDSVDESLDSIRSAYADSTMLAGVMAFALERDTQGDAGDEIEIEFVDGRDRHVTKRIALAEAPGISAGIGNLPPMLVTFNSRLIDDSIGLIAFSAFLDPVRIMRDFAAALDSFRDADGLIIDLRGNPGGLGAMAMGIGGWFVTEPNQKLGTMITRDSRLNFILNPRPRPYTKPLAIIVDEASMSTTEILAGGLQDIDRARVFGARTGGAALPSVIERLPSGDGLQYAFANYISSGGEALEGRGVVPDVEVIPTREALLAGRDPALDAAVEWIRSQNVN